MALVPMYRVSEIVSMTKDEQGRGGIDRDVIYDAIKRGELRAFVPNGNSRGYRLRLSDVEAWIDSKSGGTTEPGSGWSHREMVPVRAQ